MGKEATGSAMAEGESPEVMRSASEASPLSKKAEAILAGGIEEFLTHGYAATSMDRVAKAAKVSKATVYSHFQDKENLFEALIRRLVEGRFRAIFGPVDEQALQADPKTVLRALANRVLDMGTTEPRFLNFMRLILGESGRFPNLARAFVSNVERTSFRQICGYFDACPHLKLADPEATARIFIGSLVHFIIVQEILHGGDIVPMDRDRLIDSLIELITAP